MSTKAKGAVNIYPASNRSQEADCFFKKYGGVNCRRRIREGGLGLGGARLSFRKGFPRIRHGIPIA
jgi:hypothetical protein